MLVVPSNNPAVSRQVKTTKSDSNKENDAKKLNRSKSRDPLSNITNAGKASKNASQAGKVLKVERSKSTKARKASLAESDETTKPEKHETKRKSDPMVIDWEDIDAPDAEDPQALTEFVNDIYEHLFEKEKTDRLSPTFLANQSEITDRMRSILVDWLIEVHRMFKLMPETLFLAINIIDRFLSLRSISRDKLQLVGITSMLIASKYEEIYAPC